MKRSGQRMISALATRVAVRTLRAAAIIAAAEAGAQVVAADWAFFTGGGRPGGARNAGGGRSSGGGSRHGGQSCGSGRRDGQGRGSPGGAAAGGGGGQRFSRGR